MSKIIRCFVAVATKADLGKSPRLSLGLDYDVKHLNYVNLNMSSGWFSESATCKYIYNWSQININDSDKNTAYFFTRNNVAWTLK